MKVAPEHEFERGNFAAQRESVGMGVKVDPLPQYGMQSIYKVASFLEHYMEQAATHDLDEMTADEKAGLAEIIRWIRNSAHSIDKDMDKRHQYFWSLGFNEGYCYAVKNGGVS